MNILKELAARSDNGTLTLKKRFEGNGSTKNNFLAQLGDLPNIRDELNNLIMKEQIIILPKLIFIPAARRSTLAKVWKPGHYKSNENGTISKIPTLANTSSSITYKSSRARDIITSTHLPTLATTYKTNLYKSNLTLREEKSFLYIYTLITNTLSTKTLKGKRLTTKRITTKRRNKKKKMEIGPNPAERIIERLNDLTGKKYSPQVPEYMRLISKLLSRHTVDEIIKVVEFKCKQWVGTKWSTYLRPITLLNEAKFDSYINEMIVARPKPLPPSPITESEVQLFLREKKTHNYLKLVEAGKTSKLSYKIFVVCKSGLDVQKVFNWFEQNPNEFWKDETNSLITKIKNS